MIMRRDRDEGGYCHRCGYGVVLNVTGHSGSTGAINASTCSYCPPGTYSSFRGNSMRYLLIWHRRLESGHVHASEPAVCDGSDCTDKSVHHDTVTVLAADHGYSITVHAEVASSIGWQGTLNRHAYRLVDPLPFCVC
jgi:hypothetical protein